MTHYTKQIYDYEDDFDYRVPSDFELSDYEKFVKGLNWVCKRITESTGSASQSAVDNLAIINSQSNFTKLSKDVNNESFDN